MGDETMFPKGGVRISLCAEIKTGDDVQWISADEDIPRGSIGKVLSISDDSEDSDEDDFFTLFFRDFNMEPKTKKKVAVRFPSGNFKFDPAQLRKAPTVYRPGSLKHIKDNFQRGDCVHWSCSDASIPDGSVGRVKSINDEGRVVVQFAKGCWNFCASELRRACADAPPRIYINEAEVWTKEDTQEKGLIEPYLGSHFAKFNSNSGWDSGAHPLMAAFSHWIYHNSKGGLLVCDLQGLQHRDYYILTDPVILSRGRRFGVTDGGEDAMDKFFANHRCGVYCHPSWKRATPYSGPAAGTRSGTSFFFR